jgi:hypothetical protein
MITTQDAVQSFHQLLVSASRSEVVLKRDSAKDARAFRQRLYRLRDLYVQQVSHISPDAASLAKLLEFRVVGRHLYVHSKDLNLADLLLEHIT